MPISVNSALFIDGFMYDALDSLHTQVESRNIQLISTVCNSGKCTLYTWYTPLCTTIHHYAQLCTGYTSIVVYSSVYHVYSVHFPLLQTVDSSCIFLLSTCVSSCHIIYNLLVFGCFAPKPNEE
jgi:hypothetical protein